MMMSPVMSPAEISKLIRERKKKLLTNSPELVDTSPTPDLNAQDVFDLEQKGRMQETLGLEQRSSPEMRNLESGYEGMGVSDEEKKRMDRLRSYIHTVRING